MVDDTNDHDDHFQEDQPELMKATTVAGSPIEQITTVTAPQERRRRRILGRAARRRQRKFKEICAMEQILMMAPQPSAVVAAAAAAATTTATGIPVSDTANNSTTTTTTLTITNIPQVLPTDRHRIWPAVLELRRTTWTTADDAALTGQLGYVPGNAIRVVCRMMDLQPVLAHYPTNDRIQSQHNNGTIAMAPMLLRRSLSSSTTAAAATAAGSNSIIDNDQSPVVLQLYPLVYRNPHLGGKSGGKRFKLRKRQKAMMSNDNDDATAIPSDDDPMLIEPFPTIYWLTHPLLRCIVSKLEIEGYGIQLERRLQTDAEALRQMELAHLAYGQERYSYLIKADRQLIQRHGWDKAFLPTRGVAGISNARAVKCLHAHLAHYLSHRTFTTTTTTTTTTMRQHNVVGQWVWEEIQLRYAERTQPTATTATTTAATTTDVICSD